MSIFDKIKNAIFGHEAHAAPMPETSAAEAAARRTSTSAPLSPPSSAPTPSAASAPAPASAPAATTIATPSATPGAISPARTVDIEPVLDEAVKKSGQKLEWRKSIVDLMKALDLDSSLTARKELAHELNYTGDTEDSATMNVWLHKALMKKLAENGGKVPADLAD
jgi:3-oxoacyl-ACP reductase-like protein